MTDLAALQSRVKTFVDATRSVLEWEWDGRFGVMLTAFDAPDLSAVQPPLRTLFLVEWTTANLTDTGKAVVARMGGMRGNQKQHAREDQATLYGAWWPWGSGDRISIRVGVWPHGTLDQAALQAWFA